MALIHYPVLNRNGDIIAAAVTNLDLHDIARAARTYGVRAVYVVTPLEDQKVLAERIIDHWVSGIGSEYNPKRREALELIRIQDSLDGVLADMVQRGVGTPRIVATTARSRSRSIDDWVLKEKMAKGSPYLLLLGTAWGLAEEMFASADFILDPIKGIAKYNHLSVRSAASIFFDRLLGNRELSGPGH
ncbi:protein of unknown function aq_054 [Olavius algarvensis associated proteobacterium Delta 3]|nr:protein of unknown function aq_054 [Olavius algarvensis associated proteobacterium Delta 3]